jgi:hypothetical protein
MGKEKAPPSDSEPGSEVVDDQHQMVSAVSDQGAQSCNLVDVKISAG